MPPPEPPSVKAGRMMSGNVPISSAIALASSSVWAMPERGDIEPDPDHRFLEELAIFALVDRLGVGADQLHVVPSERAVAIQLHGGIQRGLTAHRGQDRVRLFALENRFDHLRRDRLDVGAIGKFRIGHDRGRIRVHEHDLVAFLAQRFAGLHAGVIELAALPDDDRAGADEENFLQLIVPRHAQRETIRRKRHATSIATRLP